MCLSQRRRQCNHPDHELLAFGVTPPGSGFSSSIETSLISLESHNIIFPLPGYRDQCQNVGERRPIFLEVRKAHSRFATSAHVVLHFPLSSRIRLVDVPVWTIASWWMLQESTVLPDHFVPAVASEVLEWF